MANHLMKSNNGGGRLRALPELPVEKWSHILSLCLGIDKAVFLEACRICPQAIRMIFRRLNAVTMHTCNVSIESLQGYTRGFVMPQNAWYLRFATELQTVCVLTSMCGGFYGGIVPNMPKVKALKGRGLWEDLDHLFRVIRLPKYQESDFRVVLNDGSLDFTLYPAQPRMVISCNHPWSCGGASAHGILSCGKARVWGRYFIKGFNQIQSSLPGLSVVSSVSEHRFRSAGWEDVPDIVRGVMYIPRSCDQDLIVNIQVMGDGIILQGPSVEIQAGVDGFRGVAPINAMCDACKTTKATKVVVKGTLHGPDVVMALQNAFQGATHVKELDLSNASFEGIKPQQIQNVLAVISRAVTRLNLDGWSARQTLDVED